MAQPQPQITKPRLLRILSAGLAGALSAFALPVAQAPAKPPPAATTAVPSVSVEKR